MEGYAVMWSAGASGSELVVPPGSSRFGVDVAALVLRAHGARGVCGWYEVPAASDRLADHVLTAGAPPANRKRLLGRRMTFSAMSPRAPFSASEKATDVVLSRAAW